MSRSSPRWYENSAAAISPSTQAGKLTISTCGMFTSNPLAFDIVTKATTAAAIGEHVMPTCEAMEATPHGRSGLMPFFSAMSQMIGISV